MSKDNQSLTNIFKASLKIGKAIANFLHNNQRNEPPGQNPNNLNNIVNNIDNNNDANIVTSPRQKNRISGKGAQDKSR